MTTSPVYIGIDVAKATIDIASCDQYLMQAPNTTAGHTHVIQRLQELAVAGIVVESTGIYAQALVCAVAMAGLPVALVQPGRARHFAKSIGLLAKTDVVDAQMLARFGKATTPRLFQMPAAIMEQLRALSERRGQVVDDRVREQNRLEACRSTLIIAQLKTSIRRLEKAEKDLNARIISAINADPTLKNQYALLTAEYGVGQQVATILLTRLPELGTVNRQQIAALAGLAPYDRSSGTANGRRAIYGGRADVRSALYMAALSAVRCHDVLKTVYQNLVARGKDKKLALIACARKLLVRLNALMTPKSCEKPALAGATTT